MDRGAWRATVHGVEGPVQEADTSERLSSRVRKKPGWVAAILPAWRGGGSVGEAVGLGSGRGSLMRWVLQLRSERCSRKFGLKPVSLLSLWVQLEWFSTYLTSDTAGHWLAWEHAVTSQKGSACERPVRPQVHASPRTTDVLLKVPISLSHLSPKTENPGLNKTSL